MAVFSQTPDSIYLCSIVVATRNFRFAIAVALVWLLPFWSMGRRVAWELARLALRGNRAWDLADTAAAPSSKADRRYSRDPPADQRGLGEGQKQ